MSAPIKIGPHSPTLPIMTDPTVQGPSGNFSPQESPRAPSGASSFVPGAHPPQPPADSPASEAPSFGGRIISLHNGAIQAVAGYVNAPTLANLAVGNTDSFFETMAKVAVCVCTLYVGALSVAAGYDLLKHLWTLATGETTPPPPPAPPSSRTDFEIEMKVRDEDSNEFSSSSSESPNRTRVVDSGKREASMDALSDESVEGTGSPPSFKRKSGARKPDQRSVPNKGAPSLLDPPQQKMMSQIPLPFASSSSSSSSSTLFEELD